MSTTKQTLFSEFKPVTKQEWIEKVTIDLKGGDFEKQLVWKNLNDIKFQPFYNREDAIEALENTGENASEIINYRTLEVSTAEQGNAQALKAVKEGLNGLVFHIQESVSVASLLKGIDLNTVAVAFVLNTDAVAFATEFFAYAEKNVSDKANLKGYLDTQLIPNYVTTGHLNETAFGALFEVVKLGETFSNYKSVTISGTTFLDSGANQVQEIAYTLNALVYVLEQADLKGVVVESVLNSLHVQLAIGSEYFVEIAKFRAFNSLLAEVAKTYGVNSCNHSLTAKTSVWTKSVTDAHTNMLRATTEAMSAILGNVDGVLVDAYDKEFKEASDFSNRIAGNITTILKEESYFGKVANPVDGSYYIEEVSTRIAEKALELFKAIEAAGGFYKAFEAEIIQQQIAEIRQTKIKLISQRRLPMVGVNKYPNLMETVKAEDLAPVLVTDAKVLTPRRASLEVEGLRKGTEELVAFLGKRLVVELVSFGNLTMRKARAAFSYDFMGVSGFEVWQEKSFETAQKAAEGSAQSVSDVVVICSSDPDYEADALTFVETFRALNTDKVLLLAGYPEAILEGLTKAGLDGCIHMKSDVINTLSGVQNKIKKQLKSKV